MYTKINNLYIGNIFSIILGVKLEKRCLRYLLFISTLTLLFFSIENFVYADILINEFLPNSVNTDYEWVEIYNNGASPVNISDFNISEEAASKNFTIKDFILEPSSFVVLVRNDEVFNKTYNINGIKIIEYGEVIPSLNLNDGSDSIFLYNSNGQLIDSIKDYLNPGENVSIGRYPDGSAGTIKLLVQTPGNKNDKTATSLNWIYPSNNNTYVNYLVNLIVEITDDTATVEYALVNINSTNFSMSNNAQQWSYLWDTSIYKPQSYNITVYFKDSYGKIGYSTIYNVIINNTEVINQINNPPILKVINLTITDFLNRANGSLIVSWLYFDEDNDIENEKEILWFVDNVENPSLRNHSSISGIAGKNQIWISSVRVFDGKNWSTFYNSTPLQIANSAPTQSKPIITSNDNKIVRNSTLTCNGNSFDIDNDAITIFFKWYKNNKIMLSELDILIPGNFSKYDEIICEQTPFDGTINGTSLNSSSLKISNSAPILVSRFKDITSSQGKNITINLINAFMDLDGDVIKLSASNADNITIKIDNNTKISTIIPHTSFSGVRKIAFFASDGTATTKSNDVILTVNLGIEEADGVEDKVLPEKQKEAEIKNVIVNENIDSLSEDNREPNIITGKVIDSDPLNKEKKLNNKVKYILVIIPASIVAILSIYFVTRKFLNRNR